MKETKLNSQTHFTGKIFTIHEDQVRLSNGKASTREVVRHHEAVVIIAYEAPDTVYLIKQFRYPIDQVLLEAPAGLMERGEDPLEAARRELREETGFTADKWTKLGQAYPSAGFCDELMHYYLAESLTPGQTDFDEDEYVELQKLSFAQIETLIDEQKLIDAKTLNVYLLLKRHLTRR